jgi:hypothetical protein
MTDPNPVMWWMVVLTVLVGVQAVALVVLAVKATVLFRKAESELHAIRLTAQRAEQGVSTAIDRVTATTDHLKSLVAHRLWPVFGTMAAGRAILRTLAARRRSRRPGTDELDMGRFVNEGGPDNDRR